MDNNNPAISLTISKSKEVFISKYFFPFFFGLLPEGENKNFKNEMTYEIDKDYFKKLLIFAGHDTIGVITVKEI